MNDCGLRTVPLIARAVVVSVAVLVTAVIARRSLSESAERAFAELERGLPDFERR